jgi:UDP-N-acetylglucosamine acyltransferase
MANVHPSAVVSPRVELADDVDIGPFSVIEDGVIIGPGCRIASSVHIGSGARLGRDVHVFHGAAVAGLPQDLKFGGEKSELIVGDGTVIREFATLSRGTAATGRTVIGSQCLLMAYSHVAHDCVIGDHVILVNSANLAGHVEVGDHAIIGGVVPVHQFVHIGPHCMIGGGFRVAKDVPPYVLAGGYPLHYCGLNVVGLRRRGFSAESRAALKRAYQILYRSGQPMSQAVESVRRELGEVAEVTVVLDFIARSKRGLMPGGREVGSDDDL